MSKTKQQLEQHIHYLEAQLVDVEAEWKERYRRQVYEFEVRTRRLRHQLEALVNLNAKTVLCISPIYIKAAKFVEEEDSA